MSDSEMGNIDEDNTQQSIHIEVDDSINPNELDVFLGDYHNGSLLTANEQVEDPIVGDQVDDPIVNEQVDDPIVNEQVEEPFLIERVLSEYSGAVSEHFQSSQFANDTNMNGGECANNITTTQTEEELRPIVQPSAEENISHLQTKSAAQVNFSRKQTAAPLRVSTASSSRVSASKGPTSSQNVNPSSSSRTNASTKISAPLRAVASIPGTTPKEISVDAIRNKMDSCLNAMANKITDKANRSPHAPFLAYLDTKLSNVPQVAIPSVEEEILDIVKLYSIRQNGRDRRND